MVERRFPKSTDKGSNPFSPGKKRGDVEECPRGLWDQLAKLTYKKLYHGFESHLFRVLEACSLQKISKRTDEGGFEPPILIEYAGFQNRYLQPLRHSSIV